MIHCGILIVPPALTLDWRDISVESLAYASSRSLTLCPTCSRSLLFCMLDAECVVSVKEADIGLRKQDMTLKNRREDANKESSEGYFL